MTSGLLRGTVIPPNNLQPVDADNIGYYWDHPLHQLGQYPRVGGPSGVQPYTANDRMMQGFGSIHWPQPLVAVDQDINGPKGRMFKLQPPVKMQRLLRAAADAVRSDQQMDADALLSLIRIVSLHCIFLLIGSRLRTDTTYRHSPFPST